MLANRIWPRCFRLSSAYTIHLPLFTKLLLSACDIIIIYFKTINAVAGVVLMTAYCFKHFRFMHRNFTLMDKSRTPRRISHDEMRRICEHFVGLCDRDNNST